MFAFRWHPFFHIPYCSYSFLLFLLLVHHCFFSFTVFLLVFVWFCWKYDKCNNRKFYLWQYKLNLKVTGKYHIHTQNILCSLFVLSSNWFHSNFQFLLAFIISTPYNLWFNCNITNELMKFWSKNDWNESMDTTFTHKSHYMLTYTRDQWTKCWNKFTELLSYSHFKTSHIHKHI